MKNLHQFSELTRKLISSSPVPLLFPPEPWAAEDFHTIAMLVRNHLEQANEVITDVDPWTDWLDRYHFILRQ